MYNKVYISFRCGNTTPTSTSIVGIPTSTTLRLYSATPLHEIICIPEWGCLSAVNPTHAILFWKVWPRSSIKRLGIWNLSVTLSVTRRFQTVSIFFLYICQNSLFVFQIRVFNFRTRNLVEMKARQPCFQPEKTRIIKNIENSDLNTKKTVC